MPEAGLLLLSAFTSNGKLTVWNSTYVHEFQPMVVAHSFQCEPQVRGVSVSLRGLHQVQLHEALSGQLVLPHVEILCNVAARCDTLFIRLFFFFFFR